MVLGDEIVAINGESLENLTHQEAVAAIKKQKKGALCLHLVVARQKTTKSQQRFGFVQIHNATQQLVITSSFVWCKVAYVSLRCDDDDITVTTNLR